MGAKNFLPRFNATGGSQPDIGSNTKTVHSSGLYGSGSDTLARWGTVYAGTTNLSGNLLVGQSQEDGGTHGTTGQITFGDDFYIAQTSATQLKIGTGVDSSSSTVMLISSSGLSVTGTLSGTNIASAGYVLAVTTLHGTQFQPTSANFILYEGSPDDYETTMTITDPTADRTITFPDASGTVAMTSDIPSATTVGWHGSATRIKILPRDFVANDVGRPLMIEDDNIGSNELFMFSFSSSDMFAYVPIPTGYKATHVRIYGSDTGQDFYVYEGDINSKTITDVATGSTSIGTEKTLGTQVTSDTTNYLLVRVTSDGADDEVHGGYVRIAAV